MAISKRSTRRTSKTRRNTTPTHRTSNQHRVTELIQDWQYLLAWAENPLMQLLTRSQRLRLGDLAESTKTPVEVYIREAVDNFLNDEAPFVPYRHRTFIEPARRRRAA